MLDLNQIISSFPPSLHQHRKAILREYLQYKLLEAIYGSRFGEKLVFMGGTSIHIVHGSARFSEDLDFDNQGLSHSDFKSLSELIQKQMQREGLKVRAKETTKKASHLFIYFTDILQAMGLTSHKNENLMIRIDADPQNYDYNSSSILLNRFDVFQKISVAPPALLLAQKFAAIFGRNRPMGRDYYDVTFLYPNHMPDFQYLGRKLGIFDKQTLKVRLIEHCQSLRFQQLSKDVAPFLYQESESKRVTHFLDFIVSL